MLLSPAAINISKKLPAPIDDCGHVFTGNPLSENDHEVSSRVDYQMSDKQMLFARYMLVKQNIAVPYTLAPNDVLTAGGVGSEDQYNGFTLGDTYVLSGTKVNAFRVYLNRVRAIKPGAGMFGPQDVGVHAFTYQPNYLTVNASNGGFLLGGGNFSQKSFRYTTAFRLDDPFNSVPAADPFALAR